ncbi:MAG: TolC family protein [Litorimonas sp.]
MSFGGCAGMPIIGASPLAPKPTLVDAEENLQTRPEWSGFAPEDLPDTDWVASFEDETLNALVNEALLENHNIKAAYARIEAAGAQLKVSKADRKPTVNGSAQVSRNQRGNDIFPSSNNINLNTNISWEWDLWGRVRDRIAGSQLNIEANKADLAGMNLSVAGQVSQNWFDLTEARLLSELSDREVVTRERSLSLTQRRYEGGVVESSDVRLASSSLANAKATRSQRAQTLAAVSRGLEVLLSRYPAQELQAATDLPNLPPLSGAANPQYILTKRPDLLAAEARLLVQGLQIDEARRALRPNLTFTANPGLLGTSLANTFDPNAFAATIAASLTRPLYQGGRLKAGVKQQEAILNQQIEDYANTALTAFLEVENALDAEKRLLEQATSLRLALEDSRKAEERLELRYSEGLATILQLLDAQSRSLTAEGQLIAARKERLSNRVRLHMALGGGKFGELEPFPRQASAPHKGVVPSTFSASSKPMPSNSFSHDVEDR